MTSNTDDLCKVCGAYWHCEHWQEPERWILREGRVAKVAKILQDGRLYFDQAKADSLFQQMQEYHYVEPTR